jgi:hypothetical protein
VATLSEPIKRVAPYLPFATFLTSFDTLSHGVPPKLDRTLWRSQSGFMQGLIMNSYRFFGLVEETEGDAPTEYLMEMVNSQEQRPEILRALIETQYQDVLEGHDLSKMTFKMLEAEFERAFSVTGATKQKAIAFFLKAARFAEMPLSPFLSSLLRNVSARKKRVPKQQMQQENGTTPERSQNFQTPTPGVSSHSVRLAGGGHLILTISANPFTMPPEDRNFFFSLVDKVQSYKDEHPDVIQDGDGAMS